MSNNDNSRYISQAERDAQLRQQQEQDAEIKTCSIGYEGEEATIHAPMKVLEAVKLVIFYYSALVREFHGSPTPNLAIQRILADKLRQYLEALPQVDAVEVSVARSAPINAQLSFVVKFKRENYGHWQLEVPPVNSASLIRLDLRTPVAPKPSSNTLEKLEKEPTHWVVWNADKSEGFVTNDAGLAYEVRKSATTNCFREDGTPSPVGQAFAERWGDDDCTQESFSVSAAK